MKDDDDAEDGEGIKIRRGCVRHELILNYKQLKWKIIQKTKKQRQQKNYTIFLN